MTLWPKGGGPPNRFTGFATALALCVVASTMVGAAGAQAKVSKASSKTIVIGLATASSGFLSVFDGPPETALKIAIADINKQGGVLGEKFTFVEQDTKSDLQQGAAAAIKVIGQGAQIGVVTCDLDFGAPAALEFAKKKIVSFSLCAGSPYYGPQGVTPYTFSAGVATPNEAAAGAQFAAQDKHWKTAYVLTDTTLEYNTTWTQYFQKTFEAFGGKVVGHDTYTNKDATVQTQLARLKGLSPQPDFIAMCGIQPGTPSVVRQIRAAGISLPLVMCVAMEGRNWLPSVPGVNNAYVTTYGDWTGKDPDPRVNKLFKEYIAKAGEPNSSHPLEGFGLADIIATAIKRAGSTGGPALKAALEKFNKVGVTSGCTTYTTVWHISFCRPLAIKLIENGKFNYVMTIKPSKVFYPPTSHKKK
jgi:branched-chain amino acid transport system substrate-binding protein